MWAMRGCVAYAPYAGERSGFHNMRMSASRGVMGGRSAAIKERGSQSVQYHEVCNALIKYSPMSLRSVASS